MLKVGAVTPDRAEMACNLEMTLFSSPGPGPRALCQSLTMNPGVSGPSPCAAGGGEHPSAKAWCRAHSGVKSKRVVSGGGDGNQGSKSTSTGGKAVHMWMASSSKPCWREPRPARFSLDSAAALRIQSSQSVEATASNTGPGCALRIMQSMAENHVLLIGFIKSNIAGILCACLLV